MKRDQQTGQIRKSPATTPATENPIAIPYDELDPNIVKLVRVLNLYPGLTTVGSCGGHEVITNPSQWEAGTWYVKFDLPIEASSWYVLEHLAWAINNDYRRSGGNLVLLPTSAPPYLNLPGQCLSFVIEGRDYENPDTLADFLEKVLEDLTPLARQK
jgi:hypothetical protein